MEILRKSKTFGRMSLILGVLLLVCACTSERKGAGTHTDAEQRLERLRSIPYTSVTEEEVGDAPSGVVIHDAERASTGYNLFCSTTAPEVFLIDMDGRPVHGWCYRDEHPDDLCEHAIMLENGDAVIIDRFRHLIRLDWSSNIVWKNQACHTSRCGAHIGGYVLHDHNGGGWAQGLGRAVFDHRGADG
jgi:hypothetical protein